MLGLNGKLLDFIYPVGSYYETSDTSFNPNTAWGGTWVEDTKGRVTVALDSEDTDFDTINEIGGEKAHTISILELPKNIVYDEEKGSGEYCYYAAGGSRGYKVNKNANLPHNNLQPYVVVKRWHRTA